eukprot:NODE_6_length_4369_cov_64.953088_g5_i0.p1 GENE.NODE_6_length_4369_cov_64.953088_g5_i0~~NODE_6_length_4369_cov_64.953088_g5_i0.p1  ORF type:complete len:1422 (-),score=425.11 NODE_6_length_4369_cov_64.953088_g5_i0:103-4341(-)
MSLRALCVLLASVAVLGQIADDCHCDIMLVLDASGSILPADWEIVRNFTRTIVSDVDIGPGDDQAKVGIVTFHNSATVVSSLATDKAPLNSQIDSMTKSTGTTRTDLAIIAATAELAQSTKTCKTMKVVTDGMSNDPAATAAAALAARNAGIIMVAIGVGPMADKVELDSIASAPLPKNSLALADFNGLSALAHTLFDKCAAPPAPAADTCSCDMILVLDASGSIQDHDWIYMKDFARRVVDGFAAAGHLAADKQHMGIITFGNDATKEVALTYDYQSLIAGIDLMQKTTGTTRTDLAINMAREEIETNLLLRPGTCSTVKVITDGLSNDPAATADAAYNLRDVGGVTTMAVGVGQAADDTELTSIASEPYDKNRYHISDFSTLDQIADTIVGSCDQLVGTPTGVPAYDECHCDVILVLDASGSILQSDWELQRQFAMDILDGLAPYLGTGTDGSRMGIVTFGNTAEMVSDISADYLHLKGAIEGMNKTTGTTRTWLGLGMAHDMLKASTRGLGQCKAVKVITDGASNNMSTTATAASVLKAGDYATVTAIGVGTQAVDTELALIASDASHVEHVSNYAALDAIANAFSKKCLSPTPTPKLPDATPVIVPTDDCACDLIIVLDASGSIQDDDWIKMQDFARIIINDMESHLGPDPDKDVRIGLITYANSAKLEISMSYDHYALIEKVNNAQKTSGSTRTHLALDMAHDELLSHSPPGKCKLIKVVTDGLSNKPALTATAAHGIKAAGIASVMAIGVGWMAQDSELQSIASAPLENNTFHLTDFSGLADLAHNIGDHCLNATESTPEPPVQDQCHCDMMLVIDASGSILDSDWELVKQFARDVVNGLSANLLADGSDMRIGIVTFANTAVKESELTGDKQQLLDAIDNMQKTTGTTRTDKGLEMAGDELMAKNRGLNECKTIKLITDGNSNVPATTASVAHDLKVKNLITIFAVGVGNVNVDEINNAASAPVANNTLLLADFSGLDQFAHLIVDTCLPPAEDKTCSCNIVLVIDSSGSISDNDWYSMKAFANTVITGLIPPLDKGDVTVGIVQFSTGAWVTQAMTSDKDALLLAANNMVKSQGQTYTNKALDLAETMLMAIAPQKDQCKSIKLVTDGESTDPVATATAATRLHNTDGINILAVGVGPAGAAGGPTDTELNTLASAPKDLNSFHIDTFAGLDNIAHTISDKCTVYVSTSTCSMQDLIGCIIAERPTSACAEVDAYAECTNRKLCPDILVIWCASYFNTEPRYSACTNVQPVCANAELNSKCKYSYYGECYAQQQAQAGQYTDCEMNNKYIWCAESAICYDLVNDLCRTTSVPGCNRTSCNHINYQGEGLGFNNGKLRLPEFAHNRQTVSTVLMAAVGCVAAVLAVAVVAGVVRYRRARQAEAAESGDYVELAELEAGEVEDSLM